MATLPSGKAISTAYQAAAATPGIKRYKLGAVLYDKKGRILTSKGNLRKTHPILLQYSLYPFLHAESHCILSHGMDHCRDCILFVLRLGCDGSLRNARPCSACLDLAIDVGIKEIYYTEEGGKIRCIT